MYNVLDCLCILNLPLAYKYASLDDVEPTSVQKVAVAFVSGDRNDATLRLMGKVEDEPASQQQY